MNKTLSIGLAGFSFVIEEHAYIKLSDYLQALKSSLDPQEAEEVMHDIEIRMVEIFKDILGAREVINADDVEKVIAQIGRPEQIEEQEEAYYSETKEKTSKKGSTYTGQRQLFRDPERQKIAGVCAGLAHYTGLDITVMRAIWLGFAVLGIFTAAISTSVIALIYIILWVVLPVAKTASDHLKMKGMPVNFDNLKEESNKIVQFANESTQRVGEIYNENKPYISSATNGLWNVARYVLGGLFLLMSISCIIGTFAVFGFMGSTTFSGFNELDFLFDGDSLGWSVKAMAVLGTLIPALLFGYFALKLLSPKTQMKNVGYVLLALFVALIGIGAFFGINVAKKNMIYKGHNEDTENLAIPTTSDSIYVNINKVEIPQNFRAYDNDLFSDKNRVFEEDHPDVDITRQAGITEPYLIIKKEAEGYNVPLDLKVPVQVTGNTLYLPNFLQYSYDHRFRDYNVRYELVVPMDTKVFNQAGEYQMRINGDLDGNGIDDDDEDQDVNGVTIKSDQDNPGVRISKSFEMTVDGKRISYDSKMGDSVIIDNKKYSQKEADRILDSMDIDLGSLKNIHIQSGKKEITIKTN
ncbi:PspC domain-containing protein [Chryseobacterium sp. A321]